MNKFPFASALAIGILMTIPAHAVDVQNEDKTPIEITISDEQGTDKMLVEPGESIADICEKCTVTIGANTVTAAGDEVVVVRDGKISVQKSRSN